jgi:hypothetical protein
MFHFVPGVPHKNGTLAATVNLHQNRTDRCSFSLQKLTQTECYLLYISLL